MKAELELSDALAGVPSVRLPVPGMKAKEEKTYWEAEDIGHLETFEGFPILPKDQADYTWVESEALTKLRSSIKRLDSAISSATTCTHNVNEDALETARETLGKATDELKALEVKNEADMKKAKLDAKKAALKLKKKKAKSKK